MSHEEFIELVSRMRLLQQNNLSHCRLWAFDERLQLEQQVDRAIAAYKNLNSIGSDGTLAGKPVAGNHKN